MEASSGSSTRLNSNRVSGTFRLLDAGVWVGLGAAGRREVGQRLVRQHLGAGAELLDRHARVIGVEGSVVALVDRGHRGDVAGPQALEPLYEQLSVRRAHAAMIGLVGIGPRGLTEGAQQV